MRLRSCVAVLALLAFLAAPINPAKAATVIVTPDPTPVAAGSSAGAGIYVAGGIIAVAAVLCAYDLYLKINGLKNWDGTPKKGITPNFP